MNWWVLTYLSLDYLGLTLYVHAHTNNPAHCYLTWDTVAPTRTPIYRNWRGTLKFCGYYYTWRNPHTLEQSEAGATLDHHWLLFPIYPGQTIWFYIWSPDGPYGKEVQSILFMAIIPSQYFPLACSMYIALTPPAATPPIPTLTMTITLTVT